jgi:hypothetical protein
MLKYGRAAHRAISVLALSQAVTAGDLSGYRCLMQGPRWLPGWEKVRSKAMCMLGFAGALLQAGCASLFAPAPKPDLERAPPEYLPPRPPPHRAAAKPLPEPPPAEPDVTVVGLSGSVIRAMFGDPAARTPSGPGETWTYQSGDCQVQLYLFPDVAQGGLRVLDDQVTAAGARVEDPQPCLRRLQLEHGL